MLGVTARGSDIGNAVTNAYAAVSQISWDGMHYRKDIARRAMLEIDREESEVAKNITGEAKSRYFDGQRF